MQQWNKGITMKVKLLTTSVALALSMTALNANAVDFTGYFRSGVGVSQDGDMQTGRQNVCLLYTSVPGSDLARGPDKGR